MPVYLIFIFFIFSVNFPTFERKRPFPMKILKIILVFLILSVIYTNYISSVFAIESNRDSLLIEDSIKTILNTANNFLRIGDYENTLIMAEKLHLMRKSILPDTSQLIIKSYINMANVNTLVYEYDKAIQYLNEAESICKRSAGDRSEEIGIIYSYYGRIYKDMGNYIQAEQFLKSAEKYLNDNYIKNKKQLVSHYMLFAEVELMLKNYETSLNYYKKSYKIIQSLEHNEGFLIDYYMGSALTYSEIGNYKKSIQLQKTAIKIAQKDSAENALRLAILYNNIGLDYLEIYQLNEAESAFSNAYNIFDNLGVKGSYLAELYENLGRLWSLKGDFMKALHYYQKGLETVASKMPTNQVMVNPDIRQIEAELPALKILKSKSNCLSELYFKNKNIRYLDGAVNTSLLAIELIEQLRNSYQSYESKLQTTKQEYQIFNNTLNLLDIAYRHTGMSKYGDIIFTVSEKSKSSILLSVLSEMDAKQFGGIPDSLLEKEKNLSKSITFYKENLYEERQSNNPNMAKIDTWEKYLFNTQHEHNQLIEYFELNYPKYYNLKYDYSVTDIRKLQKHLPFRTSFIEYSFSDSILFTFIITRNSFHLLENTVDTNFIKQLNQYLYNFNHFDFSVQSLDDYTEFCQISNFLYNTLLAPAKKYISGNSLIIVPDGLLSYLPFETLIKQIPEDTSTNQYRQLKYLINDFSVSYSYSATLFNQVSGRQKLAANKRLLAFAPEYSEEENDIVSENQFVTRQNYRKNLFPIPGVIEEVEAINKLIPGDIFIGPKATESNFKDTAAYYDILHLAMHTVINNNNPLYSKLIFTLNHDSTQDGLLNTYEIFNLTLNARMIVLSACSTGGGEFNNGEGIISLARGFVYAGSPSIVMSMWEVEDKSGSELMKCFYKNLVKGQSKSKAMQNAKLQCIKEARPENTHPFFWSSFVVMGNSQPLYIRKYLLAGIAIIGLVLLFLILIRLRKIRTKSSHH